MKREEMETHISHITWIAVAVEIGIDPNSKAVL
jgi:hypothetical protein